MAHLPYEFTATFTNGSANVTASAALFVTNLRPGDLVRGPDEKVYGVATVGPLQTQFTIDRNYLGTTVTAATKAFRHSDDWGDVADVNVRLANIESALALGYLMQSASSLAIGAGTKVFTGVASGMPIGKGIPLRASSRADPAKWMSGICDYSGTTLTMTVLAGEFNGSGTFADWNINVTGGRGATGLNAATPGSTTIGNVVVWGDATGSQVLAGFKPREVATSNRTYYVRPDGSDSSTGLINNTGAAFATIAKAISTIDQIDWYGFQPTIEVVYGTHTASFAFTRRPIGANGVVLKGTIGNGVVLAFTGGYGAFTIGNAEVTTESMTILNSGGAGQGVLVTSGGVLNVGTGTIFGACPNRSQIESPNGGYVNYLQNWTISAGAQSHLSLGGQSRASASGKTCTITGTPNFTSAFISLVGGSTADIFSQTWTGAATGMRANVSGNSVLNLFGAGQASLPGNASGTPTTGGQIT